MQKSIYATKLGHWWFSIIWRFAITTVLRKTVSFVYNFQQAETTRRHEQVLEHVKEKVNEILTFENWIPKSYCSVSIFLLLMKSMFHLVASTCSNRLLVCHAIPPKMRSLLSRHTTRKRCALCVTLRWVAELYINNFSIPGLSVLNAFPLHSNKATYNLRQFHLVPLCIDSLVKTFRRLCQKFTCWVICEARNINKHCLKYQQRKEL